MNSFTLRLRKHNSINWRQNYAQTIIILFHFCHRRFCLFIFLFLAVSPQSLLFYNAASRLNFSEFYSHGTLGFNYQRFQKLNVIEIYGLYTSKSLLGFWCEAHRRHKCHHNHPRNILNFSLTRNTLISTHTHIRSLFRYADD